MPATVRISDSGRSLLAQLAREADTSMTVVLDAALEAYRRQRFLAKAAAAYETLASDSAAAEYRRELADLDGTSADGLQPYPP
jgi:predicted transcriptional regulator